MAAGVVLILLVKEEGWGGGVAKLHSILLNYWRLLWPMSEQQHMYTVPSPVIYLDGITETKRCCRKLSVHLEIMKYTVMNKKLCCHTTYNSQYPN
jgi:hypothetical protein